MVKNMEDIAFLNGDAIDLMCCGLFEHSIPYLEQALKVAVVELQKYHPAMEPAALHQNTSEDATADVFIETVKLNEHTIDPSWNQECTFEIFDRPCLVYGALIALGTDIDSMSVRCLYEKSSITLLFNLGLAFHLTGMKTVAAQQDWLQGALSVYDQATAMLINSGQSNTDEDYIMLSLALLNNKASIYLYLSRSDMAIACLRALSDRLVVAYEECYSFSDAFKFSKLNLLVVACTGSLRTDTCAPVA